MAPHRFCVLKEADLAEPERGAAGGGGGELTNTASAERMGWGGGEGKTDSAAGEGSVVLHASDLQLVPSSLPLSLRDTPIPGTPPASMQGATLQQPQQKRAERLSESTEEKAFCSSVSIRRSVDLVFPSQVLPPTAPRYFFSPCSSSRAVAAGCCAGPYTAGEKVPCAAALRGDAALPSCSLLHLGRSCRWEYSSLPGGHCSCPSSFPPPARAGARADAGACAGAGNGTGAGAGVGAGAGAEALHCYGLGSREALVAVDASMTEESGVPTALDPRCEGSMSCRYPAPPVSTHCYWDWEWDWEEEGKAGADTSPPFCAFSQCRGIVESPAQQCTHCCQPLSTGGPGESLVPSALDVVLPPGPASTLLTLDGTSSSQKALQGSQEGGIEAIDNMRKSSSTSRHSLLLSRLRLHRRWQKAKTMPVQRLMSGAAQSPGAGAPVSKESPEGLGSPDSPVCAARIRSPSFLASEAQRNLLSSPASPLDASSPTASSPSPSSLVRGLLRKCKDKVQVLASRTKLGPLGMASISPRAVSAEEEEMNSALAPEAGHLEGEEAANSQSLDSPSFQACTPDTPPISQKEYPVTLLGIPRASAGPTALMPVPIWCEGEADEAKGTNDCSFIFNMEPRTDVSNHPLHRQKSRGRMKEGLLTEACGGILYSSEELHLATSGWAASNVIGKGGFGTVYKGHIHGKPVAVKQLDNTRRQGPREYNMEVQVLSSIKHPNIVTLLGHSPESRCLVYEFIPNGSLKDWLKETQKREALGWQTRLRILAQLASALSSLHQQDPPVVHRDLKPENILLDENLHAKLADVGVARLMKVEGQLTYVLSGTAGYIDPYVIRNFSVTPLADVYSLGLNMLQLVLGLPKITAVHSMLNVLGTQGETNCSRQVLQAAAFTLADQADSCAGQWPKYACFELCLLSLRCIQHDLDSRPSLHDEIVPLVSCLSARHDV